MRTRRWSMRAIPGAAATLILGLVHTASGILATGGNATMDVGAYRIHVFTNSATASNLVIASGGTVEILVVGGGGGGGQTIGGGGGAGGFLTNSAYAVTAGTYAVTVGVGGLGCPANASTYASDGGGRGSNSVFGALVAYGGGGGGSYNQTANGASAGGSGGGMGAGRAGGPMSGTNGQGNAGGTTGANSNYGAGGGGAGTQGSTNLPAAGGPGGAGLYSDISGTSVAYAGGGGGGARTSGAGAGGMGGGGAGSTTAGTNALPNTGGGGGAGGYAGSVSYAGGAGGSGIVMVRYVLPAPVIENRPATAVTRTAADLNGYLSSTGMADTTVFVYWGPSDQETNKGLWANTTPFTAPNPATPGDYSTNVALSTPDITYFYRYCASNAVAETWSMTTVSFVAGEVTVQATDPSAVESGLDTGSFTVYRPDATTGLPMTVNYAMGGTAVNGGDYALIESSVSLATGVSSATITLTPIPDAESEPDETAVLSLLPGPYAIGAPNSATVTITEVSNPLTNIWLGTGYWTNGASWSCGFVPIQAQVVLVTNGTVMLDHSTAWLKQVTITNATLTFTNWTTVLRATNITIAAEGNVTHAPCTTNLTAFNTNRVYLVCSTITVESNGVINVDAMGYPGGNSSTHVAGYGPGAGQVSAQGAGYGGRGGFSGGAAYGSAIAPCDPGSGGAGYAASGYGGAGGGVVRIEASGHALVNGTISANGTLGGGGWNGGGSGGSVYLTCATFAATNGIVRADGPPAIPTTVGSGSGGRVAVVCTDSGAQSLLPLPSGGISACMGGKAPNYPPPGEIGTVYLTSDLLPSMLSSNYGGRLMGFAPRDRAALIVSNTWIGIGQDAINWTITNDLTILGSLGRLDASNATVTVGGSALINAGALYLYAGATTNGPVLTCATNLALTNGGVFHVYGGVINASTTNYSARVAVGGELYVGTNCAIYPHSQPTNGGSPIFTMANMVMASNSQINADGLGFAAGGAVNPGIGYGPGHGGTTGQGAGGYGGTGALCAVGYGLTYGSSNAPIDAGSGGGGAAISSLGGGGGGVVRMEIAGTATLAGIISANGSNGPGWAASGGAGGSIFLQADTFAAGQATLSARGGNGSTGGWGTGGGGGGGGRIALWYRVKNLVAVTNVAGGVGGSTGQYVGGGGTVHFKISGSLATLNVLGDPVPVGDPSPHPYGSYGIVSGESLTESVGLVASETNDGRYLFTGWTVTNDAGVSQSGTTTQAIFEVTTNTTLSWKWARQYYLTTTAGTNGNLQIDPTGWYMSTSEVSMTAVPTDGYYFLQWLGADVPAGMQTNNPLTLTVDQPRTVEARFANSTPTTREWNGTGNWFSETNWSSPLGAGIPGLDDTVLIGSGTNLLSEPARVASLTVGNGATLTFSNWTTALRATSVTVAGGGQLTHAPCTTNLTAFNTNRVYLVCSTITVESNGVINADAMGYPGGNNSSHIAGYGPGAGTTDGSGGGYGGRGGASSGGGTYGSETEPSDPGSGGAGYGSSGYGGRGGGVVRIDATAQAVVNGIITANGGGGTSGYHGGGSGGSIHLTCATFAGTNGVVRANGAPYVALSVGSGGGGRVAIVCTDAATQSALPLPSCILSAAQGGKTTYLPPGDLGSLYLSHDLLPSMLTSNYGGRLSGFTLRTRDALTLSNAWIGVPQDGAQLTVSNDLTILGTAGRLDMSNATVTVGGSALINAGALYLYAGSSTNGPVLTCATNLILTNGGIFHVYGGMITTNTTNYSARVAVGGDLYVGTNCAIYPHSQPTNGGSPIFTMADLFVASNGQINASGLGFAGGGRLTASKVGYGPGRGGNETQGGRGGAGYGGPGAYSSVGYGETYGLSNAPVEAGSGGGGEGSGNYGGNGGGVVRMELTGMATIEGSITANGSNFVGYGAGGSGGSIFLQADTFAPAQGELSAKGGAGGTTGWGGTGSGGGGGGRIALWFRRNLFTGATNVTGGVGGSTGQFVGGDGTVYLQAMASPGSIFLVR